jgi:phage FluMu protein Com
MKDNQMNRGKSQSMYRYLPKSWIDFSLRGKERRNYIAFVERWNSEQLTNINRKRLLRIVDRAVRSFEARGGTKELPAVSGFGTELNIEVCDVLTPKSSSEERGIVSEISPLTFYCPKCKKVYQFRSADDYKRRMKCGKCDVGLKQFRQIYYCKCGWATDKHPAYCPTCKSSNDIYWDGEYNFQCRKCGRKIPMAVYCDVCKTRLYPKPALDPAQYFAKSLNMIDLINEVTEHFINEESYGTYISLAYWMGYITREELNTIIRNGIVEDEDVFQKKYDELYSALSLAMRPEEAATAAKIAAENACGNKYKTITDAIKAKIVASQEAINAIAEMIVEFDQVINADDISSLEDAIKVAKSLNTNANPEEFMSVAKRFGVLTAQVCGNIPFVSCSYGYTRGATEYETGVQMHGYNENRGRKNVYAIKMNTEGVLFEFDRCKIISWLQQNSIIDEDDMPDLSSDKEVKMWFANHIKPDLITVFGELNEVEDAATYYAYRLIHSISHLLIRAAAELCGLDKNSISEYIFSGIPAVLVYCQNSQGFNLGALFNVFEAYFDKWLLNANLLAQKCVYDPICKERYKACTGCLFLQEISCEHFNQDLDRTLVCGFYDKKTKKRFYGFWEE